MVKEKGANITEVQYPFVYTRVFNKDQAQFREFRIPRIRSVTDPPDIQRTDHEILNNISAEVEGSEWFYSNYWREKGNPIDQIEFDIKGKKITFFNFNRDLPFAERYVDEALSVLVEYSRRFPQALDRLKWILLDDAQQPSFYGDSENYPLSGTTDRPRSLIHLFPRAISQEPYRISTVSRFSGVLAHELTHLIDEEFVFSGWQDHYRWGRCADKPEEWELREVPDGGRKAYFNKETDKMSLAYLYPLQPEECVTEYGSHSIRDDICESVVAYIFDPDLLKRVSPTKFDIVSAFDQNSEPKLGFARPLAPEDVRIPEIQPRLVKFYIQEPERTE